MRDVYIAIMVAAAKGKGLHLTAAEIRDLSFDDAISTRACNALTTEEDRKINASQRREGWSKVNPDRKAST